METSWWQQGDCPSICLDNCDLLHAASRSACWITEEDPMRLKLNWPPISCQWENAWVCGGQSCNPGYVGDWAKHLAFWYFNSLPVKSIAKHWWKAPSWSPELQLCATLTAHRLISGCLSLMQPMLLSPRPWSSYRRDFMLLQICCLFSKVCISGHHCLRSNYPYLLPTTPIPIPPVTWDWHQPQPLQKAHRSLSIPPRSCHSPWRAGHLLSPLWDLIST